jgi:hypothetical protein
MSPVTRSFAVDDKNNNHPSLDHPNGTKCPVMDNFPSMRGGAVRQEKTKLLESASFGFRLEM